MTSQSTKPVGPKHGESQTPEYAAAVAAGVGTAVAEADRGPVTETSSSCELSKLESATVRSARPRCAAPRNRKASSAEPLAKFRATGVMTWDKAERYEWDAIRYVGQFGLLSVRQLGEWTFRDLTVGARHRQAQALTLRLCPQARASSAARRLATAGHRPVLQAFGRKRIRTQYFYYLNSRGLRFMEENYGLTLPDAGKSTTTAADLLKRSLAFEHCLAQYRKNADLEFVGRAALPAAVSRQEGLEPLARAFLVCLSNLWSSVTLNGTSTYTYVADRPGSSNGANVAHYRELARAASLLLGRTLRIEVIGRRMPTETDIAPNNTQLARSVEGASKSESFWTKEGQYRVEKLVAYFGSLKPHAATIRALMNTHRA